MFDTRSVCAKFVLSVRFKVGFKGPLSGLRQFLTTEGPLEIMKNAFYFTLKAFSLYFNFCLDFLVMQKNGLIRKIRLAVKFMTSQPV